MCDELQHIWVHFNGSVPPTSSVRILWGCALLITPGLVDGAHACIQADQPAQTFDFGERRKKKKEKKAEEKGKEKPINLPAQGANLGPPLPVGAQRVPNIRKSQFSIYNVYTT